MARFRPPQKIFSDPPPPPIPRRHPIPTDTLPALPLPPLGGPPPGNFNKNRPPLLALRTPPSPPPSRKKYKIDLQCPPRIDGSQKGGFQKSGFGGCSPVSKTGTRVHSDVPRYQTPERGYMRMFPGTKSRNEGTFTNFFYEAALLFRSKGIF